MVKIYDGKNNNNNVIWMKKAEPKLKAITLSFLNDNFLLWLVIWGVEHKTVDLLIKTF